MQSELAYLRNSNSRMRTQLNIITASREMEQAFPGSRAGISVGGSIPGEEVYQQEKERLRREQDKVQRAERLWGTQPVEEEAQPTTSPSLVEQKPKAAPRGARRAVGFAPSPAADSPGPTARSEAESSSGTSDAPQARRRTSRSHTIHAAAGGPPPFLLEMQRQQQGRVEDKEDKVAVTSSEAPAGSSGGDGTNSGQQRVSFDLGTPSSERQPSRGKKKRYSYSDSYQAPQGGRRQPPATAASEMVASAGTISSKRAVTTFLSHKHAWRK